MPYERTGATKERLALARRVAALRRAGLTHREVAARLGIARSYASTLATDPDGAKAQARKDSYRQPCPNCGTLMDGSRGRARTSRTCANCAGDASRVWTEETIVEAFQHFARVVGRSPSAVDHLARFPSWADKMSPARIAEAKRAHALVRTPSPGTVADVFGSWGAALDAAGLPRNPRGEPSHRAKSGKVLPS